MVSSSHLDHNECRLTKCIRPVVEDANRLAPTFARIFKEMIIFTPAGKPLPRTGKGTVARKAALKIFSQEIDTLCVCGSLAATLTDGDL